MVRPTSGHGYKSAAAVKLIGETQNFLLGALCSITAQAVSGEVMGRGGKGFSPKFFPSLCARNGWSVRPVHATWRRSPCPSRVQVSGVP